MQSKFKNKLCKIFNTQFRFSKFEFRIESHYRWQLFCHRWLFVCRQMCIVIKTSENFICVVKFEFLSVCLSTKDRNVKQKDRKNSEKKVNKYDANSLKYFWIVSNSSVWFSIEMWRRSSFYTIHLMQAMNAFFVAQMLTTQ